LTRKNHHQAVKNKNHWDADDNPENDIPDDYIFFVPVMKQRDNQEFRNKNDNRVGVIPEDIRISGRKYHCGNGGVKSEIAKYYKYKY